MDIAGRSKILFILYIFFLLKWSSLKFVLYSLDKLNIVHMPQDFVLTT